MADLKTVQALVEPTVTLPRRIVQGALDAINYGDKAAWAMNLEGVKEELQHALIAQMQRDAVQPVPTLVGELIVGDDDWEFGLAGNYGDVLGPDLPKGRHLLYFAAPHPEAQALDSQLQQPDGHSTRASGVCASTTLLPEGWRERAGQIEAMVVEVMDDAWADFVMDTGNYPDDFKVGRKSLYFLGGRWAHIVGQQVASRLASTGAAGAQQQDDHAGSPAPSCYGVILAGKVMPVGSKEQAEKLADHAAAEIVPLYTHPAPSAESSKAALSDEEIDAAMYEVWGSVWERDEFRIFARAILARAGITRKPLTDNAICEMRRAARNDPRCIDQHWFVLMARAVEQHHGITPQAGKESGDAS